MFVLVLFWVFQGRVQIFVVGEIELFYNSNVIVFGLIMISIGVGIDYGVGFIGNDVNFYFSIEYYIFNMDILGIINVLNIYFDGDNSIDFSISGIIFLVVIGVGESILFMVIFVFVLVLFGLEDFIFVDMD